MMRHICPASRHCLFVPLAPGKGVLSPPFVFPHPNFHFRSAEINLPPMDMHKTVLTVNVLEMTTRQPRFDPKDGNGTKSKRVSCRKFLLRWYGKL